MTEAYDDEDADWSLIPEHMRGGVERYVMHGSGYNPGGLPAIRDLIREALTLLEQDDVEAAMARFHAKLAAIQSATRTA